VFVEAVTVESIAKLRQAYVAGDLRARLARHHSDPDAAFLPWCSIWLSREFEAWNIEEEIAQIRARLLLIQGEADEYGSMAQVESIARRVPTSEILRLQDCGHSPHRDRPDAVLEASVAFLRRIALAA
jgi:pimeloyl-ACP methyl ester carboxylesterase